MAQDNVEIVRRVYAEVNASKQVPRELIAPTCEVDAIDVSFEGDWPRNYDAAEETLRDYWNLFDAFHVDLEEVIHADERCVVTAVRDGGRIAGGDEVWNRFFHVWTIADGQIARLSIHNDRGRALAAAGASR